MDSVPFLSGFPIPLSSVAVLAFWAAAQRRRRWRWRLQPPGRRITTYRRLLLPGSDVCQLQECSRMCMVQYCNPQSHLVAIVVAVSLQPGSHIRRCPRGSSFPHPRSLSLWHCYKFAPMLPKRAAGLATETQVCPLCKELRFGCPVIHCPPRSCIFCCIHSHGSVCSSCSQLSRARTQKTLSESAQRVLNSIVHSCVLGCAETIRFMLSFLVPDQFSLDPLCARLPRRRHTAHGTRHTARQCRQNTVLAFRA